MIGLIRLLVLLGAPPDLAAPPVWEKVFDAKGGRDMWVSAVVATARDDWFASGRWGVAHGTKDTVAREPTPGRAVLGLFRDATDSLFALGADELVMRFDGSKWIEEHVGPSPKPKREGRGADLLHSVYYAEGNAGPALVAFGPSLVLVRQPDHTWVAPPDVENLTLLLQGQLGVTTATPPGCRGAGWFWLARKKGFIYCNDGRSFLFNDGKTTDKGKLPPECRRAFDALTFGQGELFATCGGSGKVWKTDPQGWHLFASMKGEKELPSISVTDDCVFVAGRQSIWRSCAR